MAKRKGAIRNAVESVEAWVGLGPKAKKNAKVKPGTKAKTKTPPPNHIKKGTKVVKKRK